MAQAFFPKFKGLLPLIDVKQSENPYVVAGKNFTMDAQGPASNLGRDIISYKAINDPDNVGVFEISETSESFVLTNEGIFRLDTVSRKLVLQFKLPVTLSSEFPWSHAAVGNRHYFARKDSSVIEYDVALDKWSFLTGIDVPSNVYAVEESEGRLVLLSSLLITWSAIGDGQDLTPTNTTGAGSQGLTKLGVTNATPLGLVKTPDGFLTFTSAGIIKSNAIQSQVPYRHVVLSYDHAPINPFCISKINDSTIIILAQSGLFEIKHSTQGGSKYPEPWQPIMSEYLHLNVLHTIDYINNQNNPKLDFDFENSWFIIATSVSQTDYRYDKAYILNIPVGEWGSLDYPFADLAQFKLLTTEQVGYTYSLIGMDGTISLFNLAKGVETIPILDGGYYYHNMWNEIEMVNNEDILIATCKGNFNVHSTVNLLRTALHHAYAVANEFLDPIDVSAAEIAPVTVTTFDEHTCNSTSSCGIFDIQMIQQPKVYNSLDSQITVGPIRLPPQERNDYYSLLNSIIVGMNDAAVGSETEDWNSALEYPVDIYEDWNTMSGEEDWGDSPIATVDYALTLTPTLDGYTEISEQNATISLIKTEGKSRFYSCESMALYHLLNFSAEEENKNFHLKTLNLNLELGGRV